MTNSQVPDKLPWAPQSRARYQILRNAMPSSNAHLYAVVDASADEEIYDLLMAEPPASEIRCLFDGDPGIRFARVAPYLMQIHAQSTLAEHWLREKWHKPIGIFLATTKSPDATKRHLKKFLHATLESQQKVFFRFYDPRILNKFIRIFLPGQCGSFFDIGDASKIETFMASNMKRKIHIHTSRLQTLAENFASTCTAERRVIHAGE